MVGSFGFELDLETIWITWNLNQKNSIISNDALLMSYLDKKLSCGTWKYKSNQQTDTIFKFIN